MKISVLASAFLLGAVSVLTAPVSDKTLAARGNGIFGDPLQFLDNAVHHKKHEAIKARGNDDDDEHRKKHDDDEHRKKHDDDDGKKKHWKIKARGNADDDDHRDDDDHNHKDEDDKSPKHW
jgi:hypothetical protein